MPFCGTASGHRGARRPQTRARTPISAPKGIVKLPIRARFSPWALSARAPLAGTRQLIPETERAGSQETVVSCPEQVAADPEQILGDAVH